MIRVVADTNIIISALQFGGLPGKFLDLVYQRSFTLVTSPVLLDELDGKLRRKFHTSDDAATALRQKLEAVATVIAPTLVLQVVPDDPDDNRVLECAVEGNTHYIVSGDRHLLRLGSHANIPIFTVRRFLENLGAVPALNPAPGSTPPDTPGPA
ncbi:MAG: putative toxin-antitoxin system toxin component, PIN family [Bryobacterales bacterium]|nr:putative toxin-antitoxin system toxin component, PIN family [Bryobacterales bacterium]